MTRFVFVCVFLFHSGLAVSPAVSAEPLIYIEYKFNSDRIKPGTFEDSTRKLWRVGHRYLRLQEAPDPAAQIHGLIITNAPNTYLINLFTMQGKHVVDPGPSIDVHVPVFAAERHERLKALEMGHEFEYFAAPNTKIKYGVAIDGVRFDRYNVYFGDFEICMFAFAGTQTPFIVSLKHPDRDYAVQYLKYEARDDVDYTLFDVPEGVKLTRVQ